MVILKKSDRFAGNNRERFRLITTVDVNVNMSFKVKSYSEIIQSAP